MSEARGAEAEHGLRGGPDRGARVESGGVVGDRAPVLDRGVAAELETEDERLRLLCGREPAACAEGLAGEPVRSHLNSS